MQDVSSGSAPVEAGARSRRYAPRLPPAERREQLLDAALTGILENGYRGISIEAVARVAGVTRPVVYDHFANLGALLRCLIEREERYAVEALEQTVPATPLDEPIDVLTVSVRRFLETVMSRPKTWRLILLPLEGTPALVREHVESNRARILAQIESVIEWAREHSELPDDLDVELAARAVRDLSEQAGRMVLTDPEHYTPERYERFVEAVMRLVWRP